MLSAPIASPRIDAYKLCWDKACIEFANMQYVEYLIGKILNEL